MANFVEAIVNELPSGYQRALEQVALRRDLREDTDLDLDELIEELAARARDVSFQPVFKQIKFFPGSAIDAMDFQQMLVELYVDLLALYQQNNRVDGFMSRFYEVINATQNDIKKSLLRLNDIVLTLLANKRNPTYNEVKLLSFQQAVNVFSGAGQAVVDSETGLVGPQPVLRRAFAQRKGPFAPTLTTEVLTAGISGNAVRTFTPDKAVSADPRNFWMDVLLSETLITSTYQPTPTGASTDYNGPIVQFRVQLPQTETINQVRLRQISRFPMQLIDLRYRSGDEVRQIPGFEVQTLGDDLIEINFEAVRTSDVRIVLLQEGWRELHVHMPREMVHQQNILDLLFKRSTETTFASNEVDFGRVNEALHALEDTDGKLDPNDLREATRKVFLTLTEDKNVLSRAGRIAGTSNTPEVETNETVELQRYEYVFGLQQLEVNRVQYARKSIFHSERLKTSGSPFVFALETIDEAVDLDVGSGVLPREHEVRYFVDISERRSFSVLPEGATNVVSEALDFDQTTRVAKARFPHLPTSGSLYRNGLLVDPVYYTYGGGTDRRDVELLSSFPGFSPSATFVFSYDLADAAGVATAFEPIDITETFDSIKPDNAELYPGTDENNQVNLLGTPFILLDVIHDTERWLRRNPRDARYEYVPRQGADAYDSTNFDHDPPVVAIDGEYFGRYQSTLDTNINSGVTNIYFDDDIPPEGLIKIDQELIRYTRAAPLLATAERGVEGTQAAPHSAGTTVEWIANPVYEPIEVLVDGVRATNLTDYVNGEHGAFQGAAEGSNVRSYVHIGRRLFFDSRIRGSIAVSYRRMAQFVRLRAEFIQHSTRERFYAGKVSSAVIKMRTAVT